MKRSKTSKAWMQEHVSDAYVKLAQKDGYRARAAYKLLEIDQKDGLIRPGMLVVDLGAAPGSWSQVVAQRLQGKGHVIALDLLEIMPIPGVTMLQGDFRENSILQKLDALLEGQTPDLVISDMAPNMSGIRSMDQANASYLTELAVEFAIRYLKPEGSFLVKVFIGEGFDEILRTLRKHFKQVSTRKPKASRDRSSEVYLLARHKLNDGS